MKRLLFCVACCGVLFFTAEAQEGNLVPNPGFEERIDCISNDSSVSDAPPWFSPSDATPDVFHECAIVLDAPCPYPETPDNWGFGVPTNFHGCQNPNSGVGYAGACFAYDIGPKNDYKEYLGVRLIHPLLEDSLYHIEFFVSLAEVFTHSTWMISAGFHSDSLDFSEGFVPGYSSTIQVDNYVLLDEDSFITEREEWEKVEFSYLANGTEQYLYIGNFVSFDETELEQVVFPEDTVGVEFPFQYWGAAYYYIDDVFVGLESPVQLTEQPELLEFSIYPNPAQNFVEVESSSYGDLMIISSTGQIMQSRRIKNQIERVDITELADGIYFLRLTKGHHISTQKLIVSKALSP